MLPEKAQQLIDELNARNINGFVSAAKFTLCVLSAVFVFVIATCLSLMVNGHNDQIGNVVGAAQALTVIALSVLGFHGYKGNQILHLIRHMKDSPILDSAPEQPKP